MNGYVKPIDPLAKAARLAEVIRHHAIQRPDAVALYFEEEHVSYREWDERSNRIANALLEAGFASQTRIGYLGKNDSRYFETIFGCAKSNMVLTPISWRLALPEILHLLQDFDVEFLFLGREFVEYAQSILKECPRIHKIITVGPPTNGLESFDDWRDRQSADDPQHDGSAEDVVLQLHTSGTTGRPKGAMLSNGNLLHAARHATSGELGTWSEDDIALVPLPVFHVGGTCWGMYSPYTGGANFITREANDTHVLNALYSAPITKAGLVPAVIQMVLQSPIFDRSRIKMLKTICYGGSPITAELLSRAVRELACDFMQMFGMTESTSVATVLSPQDHDLARPQLLTSCGKALHDVELKIVDSEGRELPTGETGEILLRGGNVMKGYYKRQDATAEVIMDGWYHSGDAGYLDQDGYLYVRDRIKDMIISGGENIYPAEVEQALANHPAVLECAAIGVPSERWGEEVKGIVVLRQGQRATPEELDAHMRSQIAGFKVPKSYAFIDALPRTGTGKILKRDLREQ